MRPMTGLILLAAIGFSPAIAAAGPEGATPVQTPPLRAGFPPAVLGLVYKDQATGFIIYVETDGRHVAAISPDGKLLWRRDPFVDAGLQPYRKARPTISHLGPGPEMRGVVLPKASASIGYDSSQWGVIDVTTGEFTFLGQN